MSLTILLHSSKTMVYTPTSSVLSEPRFLKEASELHRYMSGLSVSALQKSMHVSTKLAQNTQALFAEWPEAPRSATIETFRGDIYSGLRALEFTDEEKQYAQDHLVILSGMYGLLRPYDGIAPYRLESGYRLPSKKYASNYRFWGEKLAAALPEEGVIVNVTSVEYEKLVLPYIDKTRVVTPVFETVSPKTGAPTFVAVHAKIARGAYARWLIQQGAETLPDVAGFTDLGYVYQADRSTPERPYYLCEKFEGIGLSQRLVS